MVPQGINSYIVLAPQDDQHAFADATDAGDGVRGRKIAVVKYDVKGNQPLIENPSIGGDINSRDHALGKVDAGGTLSLLLTPNLGPLIFGKWIQGSLATTGGSDPRTHTGKSTTAILNPYTIEDYQDLDTPQWRQFRTACVNSATFGVNVDGFLQVDLSLMGLNTTYAGSRVIASGDLIDWTDDTPFDHVGHLAAADILLNGSAIATITSFNCTITNNTVVKYVTGASGIGRWIIRKRQTVEWDLETLFEDTTVRDLAIAGTYVGVDLKWAQSASRSFQIATQRIRLERSDATPLDDDALMLKVKGKASRYASSSTQLLTVGKNAQLANTYD